MGNKLQTTLSNIFTNLNLTDMESCYKFFIAKQLKSLLLKVKRFGFEPEVMAKIALIPDIRIYEAGISYYSRKYNEGKKIDWKKWFSGHLLYAEIQRVRPQIFKIDNLINDMTIEPFDSVI